MTFLLGSEAISENYKLWQELELSSTNDFAFKVAEQFFDKYQDLKLQNAKDNNFGSNANFCLKGWVVAKSQTQGRGRRNKIWLSPEGNLYTSLLICIKTNESSFAFSKLMVVYGYLASLALYDTLLELEKRYKAHLCDLILKWPNDIIIRGKKLSGVLVENKFFHEVENTKKSRYLAIVVGIGVNVLQEVNPDSYSAISLKELGVDTTVEEVFEILTYYWVKNFRLLSDNDGINLIRHKWLKLCGLQGRRLKINLDNSTIEGIFLTLDEEFNCILQLDNNQQIAINTGDVLIRN